MSDDRLSLADLFAMQAEEMALRSWEIVKTRQHEAWVAVHEQRCQPSCLAATTHYTDCDCVCEGQHHGNLWIVDQLAYGEWEEAPG